MNPRLVSLSRTRSIAVVLALTLSACSKDNQDNSRVDEANAKFEEAESRLVEAQGLSDVAIRDRKDAEMDLENAKSIRAEAEEIEIEAQEASDALSAKEEQLSARENELLQKQKQLTQAQQELDQKAADFEDKKDSFATYKENQKDGITDEREGLEAERLEFEDYCANIKAGFEDDRKAISLREGELDAWQKAIEGDQQVIASLIAEKEALLCSIDEEASGLTQTREEIHAQLATLESAKQAALGGVIRATDKVKLFESLQAGERLPFYIAITGNGQRGQVRDIRDLIYNTWRNTQGEDLINIDYPYPYRAQELRKKSDKKKPNYEYTEVNFVLQALEDDRSEAKMKENKAEIKELSAQRQSEKVAAAELTAKLKAMSGRNFQGKQKKRQKLLDTRRTISAEIVRIEQRISALEAENKALSSPTNSFGSITIADTYVAHLNLNDYKDLINVFLRRENDLRLTLVLMEKVVVDTFMTYSIEERSIEGVDTLGESPKEVRKIVQRDPIYLFGKMAHRYDYDSSRVVADSIEESMAIRYGDLASYAFGQDLSNACQSFSPECLGQLVQGGILARPEMIARDMKRFFNAVQAEHKLGTVKYLDNVEIFSHLWVVEPVDFRTGVPMSNLYDFTSVNGIKTRAQDYAGNSVGHYAEDHARERRYLIPIRRKSGRPLAYSVEHLQLPGEITKNDVTPFDRLKFLEEMRNALPEVK